MRLSRTQKSLDTLTPSMMLAASVFYTFVGSLIVILLVVSIRGLLSLRIPARRRPREPDLDHPVELAVSELCQASAEEPTAQAAPTPYQFPSETPELGALRVTLPRLGILPSKKVGEVALYERGIRNAETTILFEDCTSVTYDGYSTRAVVSGGTNHLLDVVGASATDRIRFSREEPDGKDDVGGFCRPALAAVVAALVTKMLSKIEGGGAISSGKTRLSGTALAVPKKAVSLSDIAHVEVQGRRAWAWTNTSTGPVLSFPVGMRGPNAFPLLVVLRTLVERRQSGGGSKHSQAPSPMDCPARMKPWAGYLGVFILGLSPFLPWVTSTGLEFRTANGDYVFSTHTRSGSLVALSRAKNGLREHGLRLARARPGFNAQDLRNYHAELGSACLPGAGAVELWAILGAAVVCAVALVLCRTYALWVPVAFLAPFLSYGLHCFLQGTETTPIAVLDYERDLEIDPLGWTAAGLGMLLISLESLRWWRTERRRRREEHAGSPRPVGDSTEGSWS